MAFLKRFEVWVLILLAAGAGLWVTLIQPVQEGDPIPLVNEERASEEPALVIHRCTLERDYGNARLDIELRYRNSSPRPLVLQTPDVRLLTRDGREVPPFILPVEKPPQIAPRTAQSVRLRYWLEAAHLKGGLSLDIRGSRADVKSDAALDLERLENRRPRTWQGVIQ